MRIFQQIRKEWNAATRAAEKDAIWKGVPRGVEGQAAELPMQQWATTAAVIEQYSRSPEETAGLLFGRLGDNLISIADDRHAVTVAGSRSGKGVGTITPNLLTYPGSVLCIDPKGENASLTARHRAERLGQKVYVLDPFKRTAPWVEPYRKKYNPLALLADPNNEYPVEDAGTIADSLIIQAEGSNSHWTESARRFLRGVLLEVATDTGFEEDRNLVTVYKLIMKGVDLSQIKESWTGMTGLYHLMEDNQTMPAIPNAAADLFERDERERNGVISTLRTQVEWLEYPAMQEVLTGHDFDLSELKTAREGCTIYLCLPVGRMGSCSRWLRMFVNLVLEAMEREEEKPDIPILMLLDEFAQLGHMPNVLTASSYLAGFGCKLLLVLQNLADLKAIYKDRWETFLSNAGTLQFFGNSNDTTTLKYIQERLGKTTAEVSTTGQYSQQEREKAGEVAGFVMSFMEKELSHAPRQFDLLTASEAAELFRREDEYARQLVLQAGSPPMILQRLSYFDDPWFRDEKGQPLYDPIE